MCSPPPGQIDFRYTLEMTAKDIPSLEKARSLIPPGTPISITFLPGEAVEARIAAAAAVRRFGFTPVPHLSARRIRSEADLQDFLKSLKTEAAVDRVFVIAGDLDKPEGPYADTLALLRSGLLQDHGVRHVGIAGHPEGHPSIDDETLWTAMKDKAEFLADAGMGCQIVTQFTFDADAVLDWLVQMRQRRIAAPVRVGLPGPASVSTLLRFAARCGVGASTKVLSKYGVSMTRLVNSAGPEKLIGTLSSQLKPPIHGEVGIHIYPFGGFVRTAEWAHASQELRAKAFMSE